MKYPCQLHGRDCDTPHQCWFREFIRSHPRKTFSLKQVLFLRYVLSGVDGGCPTESLDEIAEATGLKRKQVEQCAKFWAGRLREGAE